MLHQIKIDHPVENLRNYSYESLYFFSFKLIANWLNPLEMRLPCTTIEKINELINYYSQSEYEIYQIEVYSEVELDRITASGQTLRAEKFGSLSQFAHERFLIAKEMTRESIENSLKEGGMNEASLMRLQVLSENEFQEYIKSLFGFTMW